MYTTQVKGKKEVDTSYILGLGNYTTFQLIWV